jgi:hypothetical protein
MELSIFLAKVIGPVLMLVCLSLAIDRRNIDLLFETYRSSAAVFITGVVELFLGTAMIVSHNIWALDFRIVLTLIGWLLLVRGIGRTFFPSRVAKTLAGFGTARSVVVPLLILVFLIGAYLAYSGFTA